MEASESRLSTLAAPVALRKLARALGEIDSLQAFTRALESTLRATGWVGSAEVQWKGPEAGAEDFAAARFALPLAGPSGVRGVLRTTLPESSDKIGAGDLHLLSALAAVLASAMDHAVRHGEMRQQLELLGFLMDLAPVGLLAFDDRGAAVGNKLARRWLGSQGEGGAAMVERMRPEVLGVDWRNEDTFHFRTEGRLLAGEVRSFARSGAEAAATHCLVLTDLSAEQGRTLDALQRELYRAKWLRRRLDFLMLEMKAPFGAMPRRLQDIRETLRPDEIAGPYDAARIAVILPRGDVSHVRQRIRSWNGILPADVKLAHIEANSERAEEVIGQALGAMKPLRETAKFSLLLFDEYPAVNDMIEMVLGSSYRVVKCSRPDDAITQLQSSEFDGFITNWEGTEGRSAVEWAL